MLNLDDDVVREKFLLNSLAPDDRDGVKARLAADADYAERLSAFEDELILRWLRGELPNEERRLFSEVYLSSPSRRARVEATREIVAAAAAMRGEIETPLHDGVPRRRWREWLAAPVPLPRVAVAAAVVIVLASVTLLLQRMGTGDNDGLVLVAVLAPPALRGEDAETNLVRIGPAAAEVWLRFEVPSTVPRDGLEAEIRDIDRANVTIIPADPPEVAHVDTTVVATIKISTERLRDGDYAATLRRKGQGTSDIATRTFRVVRE